MTFAQLKRDALSLINQYSIAGRSIEPTYNNQADYLLRIPTFADDAQVLIATTVKPIPAAVRLCNLDSEIIGDSRLYTMPENFYKFRTSGILDLSGEHVERIPFDGYLMDSQFLLSGNCDPHNLVVEYYRYPSLLGDNPKDEDRLDNTEDVQRIIPYYVAAHLVMYDDSYTHSSLHNEFETRLARLSRSVVTTTESITDIY
ncbi:MAG: hypothetical protein J6S14_16830 [Clostridia bacterium]|nr:hypothetical protein [Clostridia bacterium]